MGALTKRFHFANGEGHELSGRLELPVGKPRSFALFAHCFTCSKNIKAATSISRKLTEDGIGVLRFDFTGIGNSEGDFSNTNFSSNVEDLISAFHALQREYGTPELLIGHSLGGSAVLKAASLLQDVKAVATIAAPSDTEHLLHLFNDRLDEIERVGRAHVKLGGQVFTITKQFIEDLKDKILLKGIGDFKKALLVMHSPVDETVSVDHAGEIFQSARHPKSFISLDNADHLLSEKDDAQYAANVIGAWASKYLSKEERENVQLLEGQVKVRSLQGHNFTQEICTKEHRILADEPRSIKGDDLGFNPYELLLASLGACTSMTIRMYADRKQWPLERVEVILDHQKIHADDCESCDTASGKLDHISKQIHVYGELSREQTERLYEIAEKCPVNRTLMSEILIEQKQS